MADSINLIAPNEQRFILWVVFLQAYEGHRSGELVRMRHRDIMILLSSSVVRWATEEEKEIGDSAVLNELGKEFESALREIVGEIVGAEAQEEGWVYGWKAIIAALRRLGSPKVSERELRRRMRDRKVPTETGYWGGSKIRIRQECLRDLL